MKQKHIKVRLAEILRPLSRPETVNPEKIYNSLGTRWYAGGLYIKESKPGAQFQASKLYRVEEGDFVYNRLFAWKGSFAVATKATHGCYVSNEFPCFTINSERAYSQYLRWYFTIQSVWDEALGLSSGGTAISRNRLKEEKFLSLLIPLPTLEEQRRIVARIEELATKIEEALSLRREVEREVSHLLPRKLSQLLNDEYWDYHLLENVLTESPRNGLAPQSEVTSGGIPMLRINAVSSSPTRHVDTTAYKLINVTKEIAAPFTLKNNDVFIVRYNGDINRVAKAAMFKSETSTLIVYPDKLMRLRPDESQITPDFLVYALGCRSVRSQIEEMGKTTAGQIGVSGKDVKSFRIPVPPLEEQRRIVAYLDSLQAKVDELKRLQAETAAELDALLPSVLDRAFRGEL